MERNDFKFEICANGVESCLAAQAGGADRVELCAGIPEGGTTPSYGEIKQARALLSATTQQPLPIPPPRGGVQFLPLGEVRRGFFLHVIIRPRGGDFVYSPLEAERMLTDIRVARELGADGVVFGCLTPDGDVDIPLCQRLMEASEGMSVTFHRAFDRCRDPRQALEDIIALGCQRILTSGQAPTAVGGIPLLRELHAQANGRIILLAGCGVNEQNIAHIYQETGICEYHFSARETISVDADFGSFQLTTEQRVRATIEALVGRMKDERMKKCKNER